MTRLLAALTGFVLAVLTFGLLVWWQASPADDEADHRDCGDGGKFVDRALGRFESGWLYKPKRDLDGETEFALAPLIVVEASESAPQPAEPLSVAVSELTVVLNGAPHQQFVYRWRGLGEPQGIRMTLNGDGLAVIWEVLRESCGRRLVVVSEGLEAAAAEVYGAPLPGRRFAVERAVEETPDVHVIRAINPGPIPMGPFVYLTHDGLDVATVICRCMPSQVDDISGSFDYTLEVSDGSGDHDAFLPLESLLRLPESF